MTSETSDIRIGDRVRHAYGHTTGVVIGLIAERREAVALVALEGKLPRELPVGALERIR